MSEALLLLSQPLPLVILIGVGYLAWDRWAIRSAVREIERNRR